MLRFIGELVEMVVMLAIAAVIVLGGAKLYVDYHNERVLAENSFEVFGIDLARHESVEIINVEFGDFTYELNWLVK